MRLISRRFLVGHMQIKLKGSSAAAGFENGSTYGRSGSIVGDELIEKFNRRRPYFIL